LVRLGEPIEKSSFGCFDLKADCFASMTPRQRQQLQRWRWVGEQGAMVTPWALTSKLFASACVSSGGPINPIGTRFSLQVKFGAGWVVGWNKTVTACQHNIFSKIK
jgi:hypothetical protein